MSVFFQIINFVCYLEDCEHGKSYVVKRSDPGIGSGPLLQANRDVGVADVGAPSEQEVLTFDGGHVGCGGGGGGCGMEYRGSLRCI